MMRIITAAVFGMISWNSLAQNNGQSQTSDPNSAPSMAKTEDHLSGKTPPNNQRGGNNKSDSGTVTGWSGQWKMPADDKSASKRNEAQGGATQNNPKK